MDHQQSWAERLKLLSGIFILLMMLAFGGVGFALGYLLRPFSYNEFSDGVKCAIIGIVIGGLLGYLFSIFGYYLAELGENVIKIADTTTKLAQKNSTDES